MLVMHRDKFGEQYYILIGGAVHGHETPEQTLVRELKDEANVIAANPRLTFIEHAGDPYGTQYVYLCDYAGGEVALSPESEEAKIHAMGSNLFTPMWLPVRELPDVPFVSEALRQSIIHGLLHGFPDRPAELKTN